jgi:hypothetical protein
MPANKRQCHNKRHGEEEEVADAIAMTEEDAAGVGIVAAEQGGRIRTMRPGRGLHATKRDGGFSQEWAVAQRKAEADGK